MSGTCRLTQLLFASEFKAQNEDNLERGLQPFVSTYSGEQSLLEQHQVNGVFDMVVNGQAAPSTTDALNLKEATKLCVPRTMTQFHRSLQAFAVVLQLALGPNHKLFLNYKRQLVDDFDSVQPTLESLFHEQQNPLMFAEMLRWIQLRFYHYWDGLAMHVGYINPPVFHELYTDIRYNT